MTEEIRAAFKASGLTRFALSKKAGLHYQIVHSFFSAEGRQITIGTVEKLCDALDLRLTPGERKDG